MKIRDSEKSESSHKVFAKVKIINATIIKIGTLKYIWTLMDVSIKGQLD